MSITDVINVIDFFIFLAYLAIPLELGFFLPKISPTLSIRVVCIGILFITFFPFCGLTHLFNIFLKDDIILIFIIKLITAIGSIVTVVVLGTVVIPNLIEIPLIIRRIKEDNKMMSDFRKITLTMREHLEYDKIISKSLQILHEVHPYLKFEFVSNNNVNFDTESHCIFVDKNINLHVKCRGKLPYPISWFHDVGSQIGIALQQAALISHVQKASQLKTDFLSLISHELRTPLTGIVNIADLMLMTNLNNEQKDYVKTVQQCGTMLFNLIGDILDFSKIEADKLVLEKIPFDINSVLLEIENTMQPSLINKSIKFSLNTIIPNPRLLGDPARIKQILMNLIKNAIKFTKKGSVEVTSTLTQDLKTEVTLHFDVSDTGIGIEDSYLECLYSPFSQVDMSISRTYGGSGLGLAICKKLLALMNSELYVTSKINEGSTFRFSITLPLTSDAKKPSNKKIIAIDPGKISILFAEDNVINQKIIMKLLQKSGYSNVTLVNNGQEALDAYTSTKFDIILLDNAMPYVSGIEVSKHIRNIVHDYEQIIIFITADATISPHNEGFEVLLYNDSIIKPISIVSLQEKLAIWSNSVSKFEP